MARRNGDKQEEAVAVAIDKDKGSQYALRWAVDHLLSRGQNLTLLHVKQRVSSVPNPCKSFSLSSSPLLLVIIIILFRPYPCFDFD